MPIYKGSNEITSGNLHKGSTEIENGYKATDSFYVNETTLTIAFVDNTSANINLSSAASVSFTGTPGDTWSSFNRSLTRANGTVRITGATGTESGDTQNILSIVESGSGSVTRQLSFSGTLPTVTQTVTVTVTDSVVNLQTRTLYVGPGGSSSGQYITIGRVGWTGGGNGTVSVTANYPAGQIYSNEGGGFPNGMVYQNSSIGNSKWYGDGASTPNYILGANVSPPSNYTYVMKSNQTGGTIIPKNSTLIVSVEENSVYQAQSASVTYARTA